jgi:hypothetical protein
MNSDLERLVGRAVMDKKFRDDLLANPEDTVKKVGLTLSTEEMEKLKAGIKGKTSQQLDQQVQLLSRW